MRNCEDGNKCFKKAILTALVRRTFIFHGFVIILQDLLALNEKRIFKMDDLRI